VAEDLTPLLSVIRLSVRFTRPTPQLALSEIEFSVPKNSIIGIVGESGSGKSLTAMSIMGLLDQQNTQVEGQIEFQGQTIFPDQPKRVRSLRGKEIAMIFQDPMTALNPAKRCGAQVDEILMLQGGFDREQAKKRTLELFEQVKLPDPPSIYRRYPHQLSGGQMQRVMIAMAISCEPKLLIADEPTTALDVTVQKEIIDLLKEIQAKTQMSLIFISHDLALVSEIAHEILVMYQGKIVEKGSPEAIFLNPQNEYTKALIAARPQGHLRLKTLATVSSIKDKSFAPEVYSPEQRAANHQKIYLKEPLLQVHNLTKAFYQKPILFGRKKITKAVDQVSFSVFEGETVGLVGESGCGKTTLVKTLLNLEKASSGSVYYKGNDISQLNEGQWRGLRKDIQIIFQDPFSSLNPKMTVGDCIMEPMEVHVVGASSQNRKQRMHHLLNQVGLDESYGSRYPHQLSGGQRQRVGIARAIALEPKIIVCDESVSALDISVQAQVLNLLNSLKEKFGFTYIFISHDLSVVQYMSDQLLVMQKGRLVEIGDADEIYAMPKSPYTKSLIGAIPRGINPANNP
jgi:peptide/nickel transport system ATP-binding protein